MWRISFRTGADHWLTKHLLDITGVLDWNEYDDDNSFGCMIGRSMN